METHGQEIFIFGKGGIKMDLNEEHYLVVDSITKVVLYSISRRVSLGAQPYVVENCDVIQISADFASEFSQNIRNGKQYKLKDVNGTTLDTMLEEYIPEQVIQSPNLENRIKALEDAQIANLGI